MVSDRRQLALLSQITALRFQRDQAKLADLQTQEADLRQKLQDLGAQRRTSAERHRHQNDTAFNAGADVQWHIWVEQRKKALNTQLVQVLAQKLECQVVLQRSFGQDQAAEKLMKQRLKEFEALQRRRASYES
jgi:hypothetical protein